MSFAEIWDDLHEMLKPEFYHFYYIFQKNRIWHFMQIVSCLHILLYLFIVYLIIYFLFGKR